MSPELITVLSGVIQALGFVCLSVIATKWKNDILTAVLAMREWSDNRYMTKELTLQLHNQNKERLNDIDNDIKRINRRAI